MLGQGLESLIPPQKPQSSGVSQSDNNSPVVPTTSDYSTTPPAREESFYIPAISSLPEVPQVPIPTPSVDGNPVSQESQIFLPEEVEEKMLPVPPPVMLHQEPVSPEPVINEVLVEKPLEPTPSTPIVTPPVTPIIEQEIPAPPLNQPASHAFRPELKKPSMGESVFLVEVDAIKPNPHQPRRHFDEEALKDLAGSIREHGIIQPLVVTKIERETPTGTSVEYQLIAGERRLMASKLVGLERVPVIIRSLDRGANQSLELAIIENLQRENLNPIEMARAFARLQDEFRMTQREIATRLGKSRETVANTLRLLDLPFDVQEAIGIGKISESHGRLLLSLKNPAIQEKLFRDLVNKSLTTRELRAQVEAGGEVHHREKKVTSELQMFQDKLASFLGTPVKINQTGDSGRITINFYSHEELENILEHLSRVLGEGGV